MNEPIEIIPLEPTPPVSEPTPIPTPTPNHPAIIKTASEIIEVVPKSGPVISFVKINIYQLTLGVGFKCVCYLLDLDYTIIEAKDLTIEGDDYNNWVSDEDMTNLILSKLRLTAK